MVLIIRQGSCVSRRQLFHGSWAKKSLYWADSASSYIKIKQFYKLWPPHPLLTSLLRSTADFATHSELHFHRRKMLHNQDKTIERAKDLLFNRHILLSIFISGVLLVLVRQFWSALELKCSDTFFKWLPFLDKLGKWYQSTARWSSEYQIFIMLVKDAYWYLKPLLRYGYLILKIGPFLYGPRWISMSV